MEFSEAMDALLDGNKIRQTYWRDNIYIMINSHDKIVDNLGKIYSISKTDLMRGWEIYQPKATVGTLLSCDENQYRVVLNKSGKLDIANTKTWVVFIGNIYRYTLDDVIKSYSMKVINDDSID